MFCLKLNNITVRQLCLSLRLIVIGIDFRLQEYLPSAMIKFLSSDEVAVKGVLFDGGSKMLLVWKQKYIC